MTEKKYFIRTYGCQMNEADSEVLAGMMKEFNYSPAYSEQEADVIIYNTCAVRQKAEEKVISRIGELKHLKNNNPNLLIAVGGCAVQQPHVAEKIRKSSPFVDLIFGTHALPRFRQLFEEARHASKTVVDISENEGEREGLPRYREGFKAYVNITFGCNNFCSYCIVPYVRGRERSRRPTAIIREVEQLADEGVVEITLLGQNVNSFGKDLQTKVDFADLLGTLDKIKGIERIRYMTSHPKDFSQKLIDTIACSQHVCDHFHLPAQAGSNRILEIMNRGYTREYYLDLVKRIREQKPEASITTDLIVGFPGETEEDFAETLDLVENVRYDNAFTFVYSPRSGTPAAERKDQIPRRIKQERIGRLIESQNVISLERNRRFLNRKQIILVEGKSKTDPNILSGRTTTNKIVNFSAPEGEAKIGTFVTVHITDAKAFYLMGEITNPS